MSVMKLDEEFLALYNINYGGQYVPPPPKVEKLSDGSSAAAKASNSSEQTDDAKRKQPQQPQWFDLDETENTNVYVSNLPTDITEDEFVEFMSKCGLIMKDPTTGVYKIKLYEKNGCLKGDALCTYIKVDSVELALEILDGGYIRQNQVKVERAKFTLKGDYDPSKKPKQKKRKDKEKLKKKQEALFAWKPEKLRGERPKHEKVVVVKNAFSPDDFNNNVELILELKEDFRDEAGKQGTCKRVEIFDAHPEGVVQIFMSSQEEADAVVTNFNGRFFGGRRLTAELYDGVTKFKINETDAEREKRLDQWEKFIAEDDNDKSEEHENLLKDELDDDDQESSTAVTPPRPSSP